MFLRCICMRPVTKSDRNDTGALPSETVVTPAVPKVVPFHPPVRSVSPADVRRTGSGRVVKLRGDALAATQSKLLEGKARTKATSCDSLLHQQDPMCLTTATADRILQPVATAQHPEAKRLTRLVQRFKQPLHDQHENDDPKQVKLDKGSDIHQHADSRLPAPCKGILEASARRLARHNRAVIPETQHMQQFLTAYIAAISEGNMQWANSDDIAAMFATDVILKTQDKQTFHGKPAVLKRLNDGVGMLAKVLGSGTIGSTLPQPEVQDPEQTDTSTWSMTYTFKSGLMKYCIKSQFSFADGKIALLHNRRMWGC